MTILYAEDDRGVRMAVTAELEAQGHVVVEVFNANMARQALTEETFDVILLDLAMPEYDQKGGERVLAFMKEEGIMTPVLLLTAFGHNGLAEAAKRAHPDVVAGILHKTFDPTDVVTAIDKVLGPVG